MFSDGLANVSYCEYGRHQDTKKVKSAPHEAAFQIQMTVPSVYLILMIHAVKPSGRFINISDGVLETTEMDQNITSI